MHGLDKSVDLSFLVGTTMNGVNLGTYLIRLNFGDDVSIPVESSIELRTKTVLR